MIGAAIAALLASAAAGAPACGSAPEKELAAALASPSGLKSLGERPMDDLLNYFSYAAYAKSDVGVCAALAPLRSDEKSSLHHEDDVCRTKFYEYRYVEAIVRRSPGLFDACVADARWSGMTQDSASAACRLRESEFRALGLEPKPEAIVAACARMTAGADAKAKEKCPPYVRAFFGDDGDCARAGARVNEIEKGHDVEQCRAFAAFAKKVRAGAKTCGGHEICRALSGGAAKVAAERAKAAAKALCRPSPGPGGRR